MSGGISISIGGQLIIAAFRQQYTHGQIIFIAVAIGVGSYGTLRLIAVGFTIWI